MYKCCDCGNLFEEGEQVKWTETHGLEHPPYEEMTGCPVCLGAYEVTYPCRICGSYQCNNEEEYCEQCKKDVKKRFTYFIDNEFSYEERELLNELYDGERI